MFDSLWAVNIVPPIASELGLVEQSTVGAEEWGTLVSFPTVVADVVCLIDEENVEDEIIFTLDLKK